MSSFHLLEFTPQVKNDINDEKYQPEVYIRRIIRNRVAKGEPNKIVNIKYDNVKKWKRTYNKNVKNNNISNNNEELVNNKDDYEFTDQIEIIKESKKPVCRNNINELQYNNENDQSINKIETCQKENISQDIINENLKFNIAKYFKKQFPDTLSNCTYHSKKHRGRKQTFKQILSENTKEADIMKSVIDDSNNIKYIEENRNITFLTEPEMVDKRKDENLASRRLDSIEKQIGLKIQLKERQEKREQLIIISRNKIFSQPIYFRRSRKDNKDSSVLMIDTPYGNILQTQEYAKEKNYASAKTIQKMIKITLKRRSILKNLHEFLCGINKCATKIQKVYRGYYHRRATKNCKKNLDYTKDKFVHELQKSTMSDNTEDTIRIPIIPVNETFDLYNEKMKNAERLRKRGEIRRLSTLAEINKKSIDDSVKRILYNQETIKIQAVYRGHIVRHHLEKLKMQKKMRLQTHAAILIQLIFRSHLAKQKVRALKEYHRENKRCSSVITIQALYRGHRVRKRTYEENINEILQNKTSNNGDKISSLPVILSQSNLQDHSHRCYDNAKRLSIRARTRQSQIIASSNNRRESYKLPTILLQNQRILPPQTTIVKEELKLKETVIGKDLEMVYL